MIYKGTRVCKVRDFDIDKDSPHYVLDRDLDQVKIRCRIVLAEVVSWENYMGQPNDGGEYFKGIKNSKLIWIEIKYMPGIIVEEDLEKFDLIMEQYLSNKMIFRPQ